MTICDVSMTAEENQSFVFNPSDTMDLQIID